MGNLLHDAPEVSETDIEDAMAFQQDSAPNDVDMMVDSPPDEDEEIEALFASYEQQQTSRVPQSPTPSDGDYDDIFAELIAQEHHQGDQPMSTGDQMDFRDEDNVMSF
jgi:hypothetical protein